MGPSPERDGNASYTDLPCILPIASMGPSPERDGNREYIGGVEEAFSASMGPSPERDGNVDIPLIGISIMGLQWGHPLKGMEIFVVDL